jgi:hypothetical protein
MFISFTLQAALIFLLPVQSAAANAYSRFVMHMAHLSFEESHETTTSSTLIQRVCSRIKMISTLVRY